MTKRRLLVGLLASLLCVAVPARARACGSGGALIAVLAVGTMAGTGAVAQTLAFTIDDVLMAKKNKEPTRNDGIVELAFNLPVTLGLAAVIGTMGLRSTSDAYGNTSLQTNGYIFGPALFGAVWTAALSAHGIWAIVKARPSRPAPDAPAAPASPASPAAPSPPPQPGEPAAEPDVPGPTGLRGRGSPLHLTVTPTLVSDGKNLGGGIGFAGTF